MEELKLRWAVRMIYEHPKNHYVIHIDSYKYIAMEDKFEERWVLPPLTQPLIDLLTEIHGMGKGGLDD